MHFGDGYLDELRCVSQLFGYVEKLPRNGVLAAKAIRMHVVATTNLYTKQEDLSAADIIVTCLGDPDGEKAELKKGDDGLLDDGVLTLDGLLRTLDR